jgi:transcriptional regulator with GAF, ATPase, and Fis domain
MTAPGLTCATCSGPLYPHLVQHTNEGWVHVSCPCQVCGKPTAKRDRRTCSRTCGAIRAHALRAESLKAREEDVLWMAETGESLSGAARRLGMTRDTLWQWLRRHGMRDVLDVLMAREPWRIDNRQPGEAA